MQSGLDERLLKSERIGAQNFLAMQKDIISHYPVSNGDTTLLKLRSGLTILVDCKIRNGGSNPNDDATFDVKSDLLKQVRDTGSRYELDVFILTHPDKDHCHGFRKHFYQGDPANYGKDNYERGEILIGELWVTSLLFTYEQSDDANAVRTAVNRRKRLYKDEDATADSFGNRLVLVGYDEREEFKNVPKHIPGQTVTKFNGQTQATFEMFIHSPFKDTLVECRANKERNSASIVFQARFLGLATNSEPVCRLMMGGDADHCVWEQILIKSKKYNNEDKLKWDIWLAVHHCSWTFFNDVPYNAKEENKTPKDYSLKLLDYGRKGGYIIASCKPIVDNEDNPPHFKARKEYLTKVGSDHFLNTAIHPNEEKPEPIVFEVTDTGYSKMETDEEKRARLARKIASTGVGSGYFGGHERF